MEVCILSEKNKSVITKENLINIISNKCKDDYVSTRDLFKLIDECTDEDGIISRRRLIKSVKNYHTKSVIKDIYNLLAELASDLYTWMTEVDIYENIEELAPILIAQKRKIYKGVSPNVDFYSGFVYTMLGLPQELFTPIFAIARIPGWCAHRMEEFVTAKRIIRPAYKCIATPKQYIPLDER